MSRVVVVGDVLHDRVMDDLRTTQPWRARPSFAPQPGSLPGGAWRTAATLHRAGHEVELVSVTATSTYESSFPITIPPGDRSIVERLWIRYGAEMIQVNYGDRDGGRTESVLEPETVDPEFVIVQDYGQGTVQAAMSWLLHAAAKGQQITWDPHPLGPPPLSEAVVVTDRTQFALHAGAGSSTYLDLADAMAGSEWAKGPGLVVTLGANGCMTSSEATGEAFATTVFEAAPKVVGAGDVFVAALARSRTQLPDLRSAALEAVAETTRLLRTPGAGLDALVHPEVRVPVGQVDCVATAGCFDFLHIGHAALLAACRRMGRTVVVLVNSDESVRRLKGAGRPFNSLEARRLALLATGLVDNVIEFDDDTPARALRATAPQLYVKGADYTPEQIPERVDVEASGGRVLTIPLIKGISTTAISETVNRGGTRGQSN